MTAGGEALRQRLAYVQLGLVVLTTFGSYGYFHPDEHFQILELVGLKLGLTGPTDLTWEYGRAMRPWLQPAIYYGIARAIRAVGIWDTFWMAWVFRLATALLAWRAASELARAELRHLTDLGDRRAHVLVTSLAPFLPYLFARASSENLSGALLALGYVALVRAMDARRARAFVVAGVLLGLACEVRYQSAFFVIGLGLWAIGVARLRRELALLALGVAATVPVGLLCDRWGYGRWVFAPWEYFRANVVEGAAAGFGREPFVAYLWLPAANVLAPAVVIVSVSCLLAWIRHRRHPLTWGLVAYVVAHSAVSHKEERFMFPVAAFAASMVVLGLSPSAGGATPALAARAGGWLWSRRASLLAKGAYLVGFAALALLAVYPLSWRSAMQVYRWFYRNEVRAPRVFTLTPVEYLPFYMRERWDMVRLSREVCIADQVVDRPSYLVVDPFGPPVDFAALGVRGRHRFTDTPIAALGPTLARVDAWALRAGLPAPRVEWHAIYEIARSGEGCGSP